jgi:hypothetical protein
MYVCVYVCVYSEETNIYVKTPEKIALQKTAKLFLKHTTFTTAAFHDPEDHSDHVLKYTFVTTVFNIILP